MSKVFRGAGISRWREVGDTLIREIDQGIFAPGDRFPAELDLVERFGVARQTVRRALSHLRDEGLIDVQLGRGTFVAEKVFKYRIAAQRTLEQNLLDSAMTPTRDLLEKSIQPATSGIADKLRVEAGEQILLTATLGRADGTPVSLVRTYFPLSRFPGIEKAFDDIEARRNRLFSPAQLLKSVGVSKYHRSYIRLKARLPDADEVQHLQLSSSDVVVETNSVSEGKDGLPVFYSISSYAGNRVEFFVDKSDLTSAD